MTNGATTSSGRTLRLLFPQGQGGNGRAYAIGARLLSLLAPDNGDEIIEVPVKPFDPDAPEMDGGIFWRSDLKIQLASAQAILASRQPDRVVVFGGDCLVQQAPLAYLNEKYRDRFGILWIDAHPDVATPQYRQTAHTMVLGNLLGLGDSEFSAKVPFPVEGPKVAFAGLANTFAYEDEVISSSGAYWLSVEEQTIGQNISDWIRNEGIDKLAIHLDIDVLDPQIFRSTMFARPDASAAGPNPRRGLMSMAQLKAILAAATQSTDIVGFGVTEYMPWDAIDLSEIMASLPIFQQG